MAWRVGAAGNARWGGVLLRDVLEEAGIGEGARHVAFTGLDRDVESGTGAPFGGSVPIERAVADGTLLAYEMNGRPLAPEHGFPLRAVVGGYVGARSVKWLSGITLQAEPSGNYYQAVEYKLFPPHVTAENADYSEGEMLGEIPLNCVILTPENGETVVPGSVPVRGYAVAGGDRGVVRVEVSADGGGSWTEASLLGGGGSGRRRWGYLPDLTGWWPARSTPGAGRSRRPSGPSGTFSATPTTRGTGWKSRSEVEPALAGQRPERRGHA